MWESDWWGEKVSFLARLLVLARHSCSSTSFVGSSVHLLILELRQWVRKSHVRGSGCGRVMLVWCDIQTNMAPYYFMLGTR